MNKKLLAVAISAALVAPAAAMADVVLYGHAQVEVSNVEYEDDMANDGIVVADNARGRLGVKASEDLGNGLKAIAQFEWRVNTDQGGAPAGNRVSQVGLTGGFGTFVLGNLKSPYKYAGGVKYDAFVATALEARRNGGMSGGALGTNSFIPNLIAYASPKGPFTATIAYGPEENDGRVAWDLKYSQSGIEVFVAGIDNGDMGTVGAGADYSAIKLGGAFKTGPHKILAQYESIDSGVAAADDVTIAFLAYQLKMGKNTFVIQYAQQDDADSVANTADGNSLASDTTYAALGVIHKMSKTTRVFGGWRDSATDNDTGDNVISIGLRKDFKS